MHCTYWSVRFAEDYYETNVSLELELVERIYAHEGLSEEMVQAINPEVSLADLDADIDEIGYPTPPRELHSVAVD